LPRILRRTSIRVNANYGYFNESSTEPRRCGLVSLEPKLTVALAQTSSLVVTVVGVWGKGSGRKEQLATLAGLLLPS
jgi:hypothetical protein